MEESLARNDIQPEIYFYRLLAEMELFLVLNWWDAFKSGVSQNFMTYLEQKKMGDYFWYQSIGISPRSLQRDSSFSIKTYYNQISEVFKAYLEWSGCRIF